MLVNIDGTLAKLKNFTGTVLSQYLHKSTKYGIASAVSTIAAQQGYIAGYGHNENLLVM